MLDVILYRIDRFGQVDLTGQPFETLDSLVKFFASDAGDSWDWVEVLTPDPMRPTRYSAEDLRAMIA